MDSHFFLSFLPPSLPPFLPPNTITPSTPAAAAAAASAFAKTATTTVLPSAHLMPTCSVLQNLTAQRAWLGSLLGALNTAMTCIGYWNSVPDYAGVPTRGPPCLIADELQKRPILELYFICDGPQDTSATICFRAFLVYTRYFEYPKDQSRIPHTIWQYTSWLSSDGKLSSL